MSRKWPEEDVSALKRLAIVGGICMFFWIVLLGFSVLLGNLYG
ncbi:MAG TPA: hypothetical protein QF379_03540 [SAR86 cluster bacterium]|jgi:hypothetical protein|nr:hypothetical protein [SAR86 cluster bacterium]|tara:strand:+ start:4290 stop:4418 length:129 start_codon:yes stop_codon:yes gene_type:complete